MNCTGDFRHKRTKDDSHSADFDPSKRNKSKVGHACTNNSHIDAFFRAAPG